MAQYHDNLPITFTPSLLLPSDYAELITQSLQVNFLFVTNESPISSTKELCERNRAARFEEDFYAVLFISIAVPASVFLNK